MLHLVDLLISCCFPFYFTHLVVRRVLSSISIVAGASPKGQQTSNQSDVGLLSDILEHNARGFAPSADGIVTGLHECTTSSVCSLWAPDL